MPFCETTKQNEEKFMEYKEFERIMSKKRMGRYLAACNGDTRKAMTLYRYNLHLTQDVFTVISCFEVALRNAINARLVQFFGEEWLKDSIQPNGIFSGNDFRETRKIIERAYNKLMANGTYSHSKLLAEMEFGVWKYMFSAKQYRATGRSLTVTARNGLVGFIVVVYCYTELFTDNLWPINLSIHQLLPKPDS